MKHQKDTIQVCDIQGNYHFISSGELIDKARQYALKALAEGPALTNPKSATDLLNTLISHLEHEVFVVIWLNSQHKVIQSEEMFRGSIDGASIYPREVVKAGLACNAAAVIFAHNHPSGHSEPSSADIQITKRLKEALSLMDIRLLDHFVIGTATTSMAEKGLL